MPRREQDPISDTEAFRELIGRVRSGDDRAAEELVRRYEPTIRLAIRVRLDQSDLRRLFDSMDLCQSVMANFFVRAASGQFELDQPEQLVKLLVTMARNKLINYVHHQQAERRDCRRQVNVDETVVAAATPTPSQVATYRELLDSVRNRLSGEERRLADLRGTGSSWPEIAAEVGENADALRFRLTRALDRVASELRLDA
jgi:RNA polymerase sigma-70 factor (ECF subfamily)